LILFIDTTPLIDKYRVDSRYLDAGKQSMDNQLAWIDSTLRVSNAKWKIVLGHHPIYSGTTKSDVEREDLQKRLKPILDKYNVDITIAGHIHNFQHVRVAGSGIDFIVNSSASLSREVVDLEGVVFRNPESGFSLCSVNDDELIITMVNKEGKVLYQYKRKK